MLREVTGHLNIQNFNKSGNPTNLGNLLNIKDVGSELNIKSNTEFLNASFPRLAIVWKGITVRDNSNLKVIMMPKLYNVKLYLKIINNPKAETILFSTDTTFVLSRAGADVEISDNGQTASNPTVMDFKKMGDRLNNLIFSNNDNAGVANFDNIFSGLISLKTLTITNNDYLGTCCMAANAKVTLCRIISGNTGNGADISAVVSACGSLHKKSPSQLASKISETNIAIYPNPSKGQFGLEINPAESGMVSIIITDLMGRVIFKNQQFVQFMTNIPIHLDKEVNGQYIVKTELNGEKFIKRVILKNY